MRHMDRLFPILDVDVRMTRDAAMAQARKLNESLKLSPAKLERAAAGFSGDPRAQTFIEQEGGGLAALKPLLAEGEHVLYTWRGRLFEPGVTHEVSVYFTPAGRPYGFRARVPEAEAGAALEQDAARAIAVERARADWSVDLAQYKPVAASTFKRTGGRVDHEFRYERLDAPIGEGKLLLSLVVSGDRLSGLQRAIQVPEAFARRYQERRSANDTISAMGSVAMLLLYMLGRLPPRLHLARAPRRVAMEARGRPRGLHRRTGLPRGPRLDSVELALLRHGRSRGDPLREGHRRGAGLLRDVVVGPARHDRRGRRARARRVRQPSLPVESVGAARRRHAARCWGARSAATRGSASSSGSSRRSTTWRTTTSAGGRRASC